MGWFYSNYMDEENLDHASAVFSKFLMIIHCPSLGALAEKNKSIFDHCINNAMYVTITINCIHIVITNISTPKIKILINTNSY